MSETLTVPRGGARPLKAYYAVPAGAVPHPGVVFIHEIHGLDDDIRGVADRFAREGTLAFFQQHLSGAG